MGAGRQRRWRVAGVVLLAVLLASAVWVARQVPRVPEAMLVVPLGCRRDLHVLIWVAERDAPRDEEEGGARRPGTGPLTIGIWYQRSGPGGSGIHRVLVSSIPTWPLSLLAVMAGMIVVGLWAGRWGTGARARRGSRG